MATAGEGAVMLTLGVVVIGIGLLCASIQTMINNKKIVGLEADIAEIKSMLNLS